MKTHCTQRSITSRIQLKSNPKYVVLHENGANLRAERNGAPWRDMVGDGLVLAMAQDLETAREVALAGVTKIDDIIKKVKSIEKINNLMQSRTVNGEVAWHEHETIDDLIRDILTALGD